MFGLQPPRHISTLPNSDLSRCPLACPLTPESGRVADMGTGSNSARTGLMQCSNEDALFDHLVGAREQRWRDGEAERLGGLEIDHQLVFGRCLHRQVGRLLAFKKSPNVARRLTK